jgi:hypothetical protein
LVLLLGVVNAAWMFYYQRTITGEVAGEPEHYVRSEQFDNNLSINTTDGPASISTNLTIEDLERDLYLNLESRTERYNLTSEDECDLDDDCNVTISFIYENGTKQVLIDRQVSSALKANVTLFEDYENVLEYKIECVEDSCPQRIVSNVTLKQK